jgi:hypothetical protein
MFIKTLGIYFCCQLFMHNTYNNFD